MGIFRQFPYSNFHDMNMDELIKVVRELADDWVAYQLKWDNLYSDTQQALEDFKAYVTTYFANLDVQAEINNKLDSMLDEGVFDPIILNKLSPVVTAWLQEHVTLTEGVVIDSSLSIAGAAADAKATGDNINMLIDQIVNNNAYDIILDTARTNAVSQGINYTWNNNKCTVMGTATALTFNNIFANLNAIPKGMKRGHTYYVDFSGTNVRLEVLHMNSNGTIVGDLYNSLGSGYFTVPDTIDGMVIRLLVYAASTVNEVVEPKILSATTNEAIVNLIKNETAYYRGPIGFDADLNEIDNGIWLKPSSRNTANSPIADGLYGTVWCIKEPPNVTMQLFFSAADGATYIRHWINTAYTPWIPISGSGGGGANEYVFNEYQNTYNVTATPTITTDTNSVLQASGTTEDRTNDIITMLSTTGACRLGKGDFYVKDLVMPDNTIISGCGTGTRIILSDGNGFAVKLNTRCIIENVTVLGSVQGITPSATAGNRHGIVWQGQATGGGSVPVAGMLNNVHIKNFTGSGLYLYDTGTGVINSLEACNIFIDTCSVGINIAYSAEFNKFTNIESTGNYYGCINNGGNNTFVNCDFSGNIVGFVIDNSSNQSPNPGHGLAVGCAFNHSNSNAGDGIRINNNPNGFVFSGCSIFFSKTNIIYSSGIIFDSCNYGLNNCDINITGGNLIMFNGNIHQGVPVINVSNNNKVKFINCFTRSGDTVSN